MIGCELNRQLSDPGSAAAFSMIDQHCLLNTPTEDREATRPALVSSAIAAVVQILLTKQIFKRQLELLGEVATDVGARGAHAGALHDSRTPCLPLIPSLHYDLDTVTQPMARVIRAHTDRAIACEQVSQYTSYLGTRQVKQQHQCPACTLRPGAHVPGQPQCRAPHSNSLHSRGLLRTRDT